MRAHLAILLLVIGVAFARPALAEGVPVNEATEEQREAAKEKFKEAREAFDDRRYLEAIDGFRASFDIVASPNTHLMIGHALRELGRYAESYAEFEKVEAEARAAAQKDPKYEEAVKLARDERTSLRSKIALVTVELPEPLADEASLKVAGRTVPREEWSKPIPVDAGSTTFVLTVGESFLVRDVEAKAGGEAKVSFLKSDKPDPVPDPVPDPDPSTDAGFQWQWTGTQRYIAYAVGGLGVVALVITGVTGGMALSKHGDLEAQCGTDPCPERQDDIDEGRTLQLVSNVMLVSGIALIGGGAALWLTAPVDDATTGKNKAWSRRLRFGATGVTFEGRF